MRIHKVLDQKFGTKDAKTQEIISVQDLLKGKNKNSQDVEFEFFLGEKPLSKMSRLEELEIEWHKLLKSGDQKQKTLSIHFQIRDHSTIPKPEEKALPKETPSSSETKTVPPVVLFAQDLIRKFDRLDIKDCTS